MTSSRHLGVNQPSTIPFQLCSLSGSLLSSCRSLHLCTLVRQNSRHSLSTITYALSLALALHHFFRQRITFATHLSSSGSSLNTNRYLRLMAMAVTEIAWGTSLNAVAMYDNIAPGLRPWTNWSDVHSDFGRIASFRLFEILPQYLKQMLIIWWAMPVSAYIFFVFFAFGEDTKKDYMRVADWFKRVVLKKPSLSKAKLLDSVASSNRCGSEP